MSYQTRAEAKWRALARDVRATTKALLPGRCPRCGRRLVLVHVGEFLWIDADTRMPCDHSFAKKAAS